MGARWPWHATCEKGHRIGGFSGGSDGECCFGDCRAPLVSESVCTEWNGGDYSQSCTHCEADAAARQAPSEDK